LLQVVCSTQQIDYQSNFGGDLFKDTMLNGISNNTNNKGLVCTLKGWGGAEVDYLCITGEIVTAKPRIINNVTRINGGLLYENSLDI